MSKKLSRREMLKLTAAGAAGLAGSTLLPASAATARSALHFPARVQTTTEISYWQAPIWRYGADNETVVGAGSDDWIKDAISRFEAANPDIKVNMELIPWDQWGQKVTTAFASGDLPNVLYGNLSSDRVAAGLFDPVDDYLTPEITDNWLPGSKEALTIQGRVYGIPYIVNPDLAALSKTALEAHGGAGILDDIGENRSGLTFDKMLEYGSQFSDGSTRFFFGIPTDHSSILYFSFGAWLNGWGVPMWSEDQERWIAHEHENSVKAIQWYADAQNESKIMIPNLPKWSDVDTFYWSQNCAMRIQWPGIQTELEVAQEAGQAAEAFEIVVAGHPHTEEYGPFVTNNAPVQFTLGHTTDMGKREAAFRFASWLGTDDSNATAAIVNGFFPSTKSGLEVAKQHPFAQDPNRRWVLEEYLPNFKPGFTGGNWSPNLNPRSGRIFNQLNPFDYAIQQLQSLLLGQKTAEQMLEEMAQRINSALGAPVHAP